MKFNINDKVRIKVTGYGCEILEHKDLAWLEKPDEDGWSEWQLWVVMETFGPYIHLGREVPFETTIEILEK
jgi:hypothetical protein